jgi:hypothetical protein
LWIVREPSKIHPMKTRTGLVVLASALLEAVACSEASSPVAGDAGMEEKTPPEAGPDGAPPVDGPIKLSETGLYADFSARTLAAGVLEYAPRYPLWSDGSTKRRFLLLPEGSKIATGDMDNWTFPVGTKAWKEFTTEGGRLVETRLLWKKAEGVWFEMAYAWLDDETDAVAVPMGVRNARGTSHDVPEVVKCHSCHDNNADTLISMGAIQLSAGGGGFLAELVTMGKLTAPPPGEFNVPGPPAVQAALGYLHGNCGGCHNDFAKFQNQTSLRLRVLTTETTVEKTGVYRTAFGLKMVHPILPDVFDALVAGDPDRSGIYVRMTRRDGYGMPPQCTKVVDAAGATTVRTWITGMSADASSD